MCGLELLAFWISLERRCGALDASCKFNMLACEWLSPGPPTALNTRHPEYYPGTPAPPAFVGRSRNSIDCEQRASADVHRSGDVTAVCHAVC